MHVSLYVQSEYSFFESTIKISNLIELALRQELPVLVLADHNNMYGAAEFISLCQKNHLRPVVGLDLDVDDFRLILYAKNYAGYLELVRLSSLKMTGQSLKSTNINTTDLFVIDHPTLGHYAKHKKKLQVANYYIATNDDLPNAIFAPQIRVLTAQDIAALNVLHACTNERINATDFAVYGEITNASKTALANVELILSQCQIVFPPVEEMLPHFITPDGSDANTYLRLHTHKQGKLRFGDKYALPSYTDRLNYELDLITRLGFADYFLIIADLISWSSKQGILIGPGRGSSAGSLVCYYLGIIEVDPLAYNLLFERFINPERVSPPDIDIDIQDDRRKEVIEYIINKYGHEHVAHISTITRLGAKMALRDVARARGMDSASVNDMTKLFTNDLSLSAAYQTSTRFRAFVTKNALNQKVYDEALLIEGLARQIGTHAAGIVLTKISLISRFPVTVNSENQLQLQMSMDYTTSHGLLKIDLLGLRNLTILQRINITVRAHFGRGVNLERLPYNDPQTTKLLSSGATNGIFQLESHGMRETLRKIGVDKLEDIVAIISLFRPGPMDQIELYAARKHHELSVPITSPVFDAITKDTYGVLIYQEQIMQIAQQFAGFSLGRADLLRRAIGKKQGEEISALEAEFKAGATKLGHNTTEINVVYDLIYKFANYGFNKSHAVAYALIAYRLAYFKAHFPAEFYITLIDSSLGAAHSVLTYIQEAHTHGLNVTGPSINLAQIGVTNTHGEIMLPISAVKGLGPEIERRIIAVREKDGPFMDFFSTIARLKLAGIAKNATLLITGGVLREFGHRATLKANLARAINYSEIITVNKGGVEHLDYGLVPPPTLSEVAFDAELEMAAELEAYGFLLTFNPTIPFEKQGARLSDIDPGETRELVVYYYKAKVLHAVKTGAAYARLSVLDSSLSVDLIVSATKWVTLQNDAPNTLRRAKIKRAIDRGRVYFLEGWTEVKGE